MKRFLLSTWAILCFLVLNAQPVTQEQAAARAASFLKIRHHDAQPRLLPPRESRIKISRSEDSITPHYYVFNNGDDDGYVVVAADDCAERILAYSDTGHFNFDEMPENLSAWLQGYGEEMEWAKTSAAGGPMKVSAQVNAKARPAVSPLLRTVWNQHEPYNLKCFNTSGYQALTGCTTLAIAQVMYYYRWPQGKTAVIPAYKYSDALPATTFDWDHIKDTYSKNLGIDTEEEKEAVSKLVYYCGNAMEVRYSTSSTGGTTSRIPFVMRSYFGFDATAREAERKDYDSDAWTDLLVEELRNGRPVIYSGDQHDGSSHAFIIDGFDGDDMFHIVWGWGGFGDGYYRLSALSACMGGVPSTDVSAFGASQLAIIGLQPTKADCRPIGESGIYTYDFYQTDSSAKKMTVGTYTLGANYGLSQLSFAFSYRRFGVERAYDIGLGIFKGDKLVDSKLYVSAYGHSSIYLLTKSANMSGLGVGLADGEYTIRGIDRVTGTEEWVPNINSGEVYLRMVVSKGVATVKSVETADKVQLKVTGVEQSFDNDNAYKHLRVGFSNVGNITCDQPVYLYLDGKKKVGETPTVAPGEEVVIDYYFTATAGSHKLGFSLAETAGSEFYVVSSFPLVDASALPKLTVVEGGFRNVSGKTMYGREMDGYLVLRNTTANDYHHYMLVGVSSDNAKNSPQFANSKVMVDVPSGATVTVPFRYPVDLGDVVSLQVSDESTTYLKTTKYTVAPAVVTWTAEGVRTAVAPTATVTVAADVAAVSLEDIADLSTVKVVPNSNPNTLYYIRHGATVPTALKSKNVVKGYEAGTIKLAEGYGYHVPQTFTAQSVSYTCTPRLAYDGTGGWQTVFTPFAVAKVTVGGKVVDWCHNASDTGNFLLKEFVGSSDREVCFENVERWMPCTPYLMALRSTLAGKQMVLSATNASVVTTKACIMSSPHFKFIGSTVDKTLPKAYVLNTAGSGFALTANATVKAGEAYFLGVFDNLQSVKRLQVSGAASLPLLGDLDGNGELSVSDVLSLVATASTGGTTDLSVADVNGDGVITVADVMKLVGLIMGQEE